MTRLEQMLVFLDQDPDDSFSRYAVALEYRSLGEYQTAVQYLRELRQRDPEYVATYYQLGQVLSQLRDWDAASEAFNEGIRVGRLVRDLHAVSELQEALDELDAMR